MSRGEYFQNEDGEWIEIQTFQSPEYPPAWSRPTLEQLETLHKGLWKMSKEDLQLVKTLIEKYGE